MSEIGKSAITCLIEGKYKAYLHSVNSETAVVELIDTGFTKNKLPIHSGQLVSVPLISVTIQRGGFKNEVMK